MNEKMPSGYMYAAYRDATCVKALTELGIDGFTEAIAFHAQQSAEKQLKAALSESGIVPDYTHNLTLLLKELSDKCSLQPSRKLIESVGRLSRHAVATRYSMSFEVARGEALQAIVDCNEIAGYLRENGFDSIEIDNPAKSLKNVDPSFRTLDEAHEKESLDEISDRNSSASKANESIDHMQCNATDRDSF